MEDQYPIKDEWENYYNTLEVIRKSGATNMWGATPYLRCYHPELDSDKKADEVLFNWMHNYNELSKKYNWRS